MLGFGHAAKQRQADNDARQAMHLAQLKAITDANHLALRSLLTSAEQARKDAASAQVEADLRVSRDREAYLAALTAIRDVAESNSQVVEGLTKAVTSYLELFKSPTTEVKGHVHTDATEWEMEQDALREKAIKLGFPAELGPEAQLSWVLAQTDRE